MVNDDVISSSTGRNALNSNDFDTSINNARRLGSYVVLTVRDKEIHGMRSCVC